MSLLAWLANRDRVPTGVGDTTSFISEGNDKFPAGQKVTVPTIAGHRAIADVGCPGDATQTEVVPQLQGLVSGERLRIDPDGDGGGTTPATPTGDTSLPAAEDDATTTSVFETTPVTRRTVGFEASPLPEAQVNDQVEGNEWAPAAITGGLAAAAVGAGAVYAAHRHRTNRPLNCRTAPRPAMPLASERALAVRRTPEPWTTPERSSCGLMASMAARPGGCLRGRPHRWGG